MTAPPPTPPPHPHLKGWIGHCLRPNKICKPQKELSWVPPPWAHTKKRCRGLAEKFSSCQQGEIFYANPECILSTRASSWCFNLSGMRKRSLYVLFPNFIDGFQYLAKNIEAWFKTRYVVQNVSRHLSYLALPVIRDRVQLGILSKGQTVTHCCEKQQIYESKFQGKNYPLWLPRNKIRSAICIFSAILLEQSDWALCDNTELSLPSTEAMKPHVSVLGIPRFVLVCCALVFSWTKGDKTTRRFVGLPESGQRVSHNDTNGNNRTLIIRHNLPVSQVVHRSDIYPQWHTNLSFQAPLSLMRAAAKTSKRSRTRSGKMYFSCWVAKNLTLFRPAEFNLNCTEQQSAQSS